jgi:hypothetical protein
MGLFTSGFPSYSIHYDHRMQEEVFTTNKPPPAPIPCVGQRFKKLLITKHYYSRHHEHHVTHSKYNHKYLISIALMISSWLYALIYK